MRITMTQHKQAMTEMNSMATRIKLGKGLVTAILLAGLGACAQTGGSVSDPASGTAAESIAGRYPEASIQSEETADRALEEVREALQDIRAQFALEKRACYERFFTNLCLDDIDERERIATEKLRRVEVDANALKRRNRAAQRDDRAGKQDKSRLHIPADTGSASPK